VRVLPVEIMPTQANEDAYLKAIWAHGGYFAAYRSGAMAEPILWPPVPAPKPAREPKRKATPICDYGDAPARVREVLAAIADKHRVTVAELVGRSRRRRLAWPRHEAMAAIRKLRRQDGRPFSLPQIGHWLGDVDHTSVLYGIKKYEARAAQSEAA